MAHMVEASSEVISNCLTLQHAFFRIKKTSIGNGRVMHKIAEHRAIVGLTERPCGPAVHLQAFIQHFGRDLAVEIIQEASAV